MNYVIRTLSAFTALAMTAALPLSAQVTSAAATAQSGTALSLEEAVRMGESHSEAVGIARAGVQRSEGQDRAVTRAHSNRSIPARSVDRPRPTLRLRPRRLVHAISISRTRALQ